MGGEIGGGCEVCVVCDTTSNPHTCHTCTHTHSLEMLDKVDTPVISDGYPLVVAMNALLDAIKSISLVINGEVTKATPTLSSEVMPTPGKSVPSPSGKGGRGEGG